jgi:hypothetical protein
LDESTGVQTNAFLHWDKLCRYHSSVVIALLQQNLSTKTDSRITIWNNWYYLVNAPRVGAGSSTRGKRGAPAKEQQNVVRNELIRNAKAASEIVKLLDRFAPPNSRCE